MTTRAGNVILGNVAHRKISKWGLIPWPTECLPLREVPLELRQEEFDLLLSYLSCQPSVDVIPWVYGRGGPYECARYWAFSLCENNAAFDLVEWQLEDLLIEDQGHARVKEMFRLLSSFD